MTWAAKRPAWAVAALVPLIMLNGLFVGVRDVVSNLTSSGSAGRRRGFPSFQQTGNLQIWCFGH